MVYLEWGGRYRIGHPLIDSQHGKLVALINDLHESMMVGRGKNTSYPILKDLLEYADYHFSDEESLLEENEYPHLLDHRIEHKLFLEKVRKMSADLDEGEYLISIQLNEFLKSWLTGHVLGSDKRFIPYVSKGSNSSSDDPVDPPLGQVSRDGGGPEQ